MPPVRPEAPLPREADSRTRMDLPGASLAREAAAESPVKPAPTMAKSTRSGRGRRVGRKEIAQGGVPQGWERLGIGELDAEQGTVVMPLSKTKEGKSRSLTTFGMTNLGC